MPKGQPVDWTAIRVSQGNKKLLEQAGVVLQVGRIDPKTGEFLGPTMNDLVRVLAQTVIDARRKLGYS